MINNLIKSALNKISPNISRYYRNIKTRRLLYAAPHNSPDGLMFIGAQNYDCYEPNITKALSEIIKDREIFINVGANHGIYCLKFSKYANTVYAFEALPDNLSVLYKNIKINSLEHKIRVFPVAAGKEEYVATFYGAATGGSLLQGWNNQIDKGIDIPVFSLDFLLFEKLKVGSSSLVLIDVEGAEFDVVQGAANIIENIKNVVFCIEIPCREFMPGETFNPNFARIFKYFNDLGYLAYEINNLGELLALNMEAVSNYVKQNRFEGIMAIFTKNPLH